MKTVLRHLDLFSGIGGFSLAAQMVGGIRTEQFVEIDPYCQRVLKKNFPGVPIHDDIRTYTANLGEFDLITFGSPCQDVSFAGKGAGIKEGT
jgi:DNA (cytosine-5)-methyltransferase 1